MDYHHTSGIARLFEPLLSWLHRTGFFNFYVYVPFFTVLGVVLFLLVRRYVRRTGYLAGKRPFKRSFWLALYLSVSWVATSTFGVALKTMIVEELDYQERKWFESYLAPTHLLISSVAVAYLVFISRTKRTFSDLILFAYLQIALVAGYVVAGYRVANEDIEGATGGVLLVLFFLVCNYDIITRVRKFLLERSSTRTQVSVSEKQTV